MEQLHGGLNPVLALGVRAHVFAQEVYLKVHGFPEFQYTNESLEAIVAGLDVQKGDRVLAICGSGDQSFAILERAQQVEALDVDLVQLEYAKWRANLLRLGRFDKFLQVIRLEGDRPQMRARNGYFTFPGRLARIRDNVDNLRFVRADIADINPIPGREFSKIYLSNVISNDYSVRAFRRFEEFLGRLACGLDEGGLIFLSNLQQIERDATRLGLVCPYPSSLEVCEPLTVLAREKERETQSFWVPIVYRKVSISN